LFAFKQTGKDLDEFAYFRVGREIARFDVAAAESFGGLAFGGEVLGFDSLVHQARGFKSNGVAEFGIGHSILRRFCVVVKNITSLSSAAARLVSE
jgi:hypothetical protein